MTQQSPTTKTLLQKIYYKNPKVAQLISVPTALIMMGISSTVLGIPLWFVGAYKVLTKSTKVDNYIIGTAKKWITFNNYLIDTLIPKIDWRITLPDDLDPNKKYLVISNHLSSLDIAIVQYISYSKNVPIDLPFTRFFTKFGAIYIPFLGQAFYFLDFPMIKRQKPSNDIEKSALQHHNTIEAKKACKSLKDKPFMLLNYIEGTRFTKELHQQQQSPYTYLLKPKAGGISTAINALGDDIDGILDMTVVYPEYQNKRARFMHLWQGNIQQLAADICHVQMPEDLFAKIKAGDYNTDQQTKAEMFTWLDGVWQAKDKRIAEMLQDFR